MQLKYRRGLHKVSTILYGTVASEFLTRQSREGSMRQGVHSDIHRKPQTEVYALRRITRVVGPLPGVGYVIIEGD
jgi:hypothetical protein